MKSNTEGKLKFINHACYYVESKNSILICDPWLEGLAFNNGWTLLDKSTSNKETIKELIKTNKKIFIWYSHEHSDHFSISFLKELYKTNISPIIIFQKTLDRRIIKYLNSKNISNIEAINGKKILLDSQLSIHIWSHNNGDSFSLLKYKNIKILNLNDCIINNEREAKRISSKIHKSTKNIDFLFTQFGYANWIGNKEDKNIRLEAAAEKIKRILYQNNILCPKIIIPFASFIIFCDKENFYLNKEQNTPSKVKNSYLLKTIREKILFLKPNDLINLEKYNEQSKYLESLSNKAIKHWGGYYSCSKPINIKSKIIEFKILKNQSKKFLEIINKTFLFFPALLEALKILKPVCFYVKDLDKQIYFSYLNKNISKKKNWDIKTNSEDLYHSLKHEYGFNTLRVNGKFEVNDMKSYKRFLYFFYFQDLVKENISFKEPFNLLKKIMHISIIFIKNTISFRI